MKTRTTTTGELVLFQISPLLLDQVSQPVARVADGDKFGEFNLNLWGSVIAIVHGAGLLGQRRSGELDMLGSTHHLSTFAPRSFQSKVERTHTARLDDSL